MRGPHTLVAALAHNAATRTRWPALIDGSGPVEYGVLEARSRAVARALRAAGIEAGDRVLYLAQDTVAVYELLYGCARIGAVLIPVNWRLTTTEIGFILDHSGVRFVVTETPDRLGKTCATVVTLPDYPAWRDAAPEAVSEDFPATTDTPVVQMYTSGTTGRPKGVVLAHRTFFAVRTLLDEAGLDWIDWRADDVGLIALPSFHIGGMWWATQGLNAGVTSVVLPSFTAAGAVASVRDHGITTSCFVPAMLLLMLSEPDTGPADFASLRKIVYGGSPIGPDLLARAVETFGCDFAQIYGLTETGNTAICLPPADHRPGRRMLHAAGRPYPGVGVQIRRLDGMAADPGESGEVLLHSPARMVEYFADPDATAATVTVDGWVRTGDAGYLDDEGYLVIRDRVKDLIIVAGENVYPAEVEKAIGAHPDVHDCAVVGAPDDRWGERVHAFVVPRPGTGLTTRGLVRFLTGRLAGFKVPSRYDFVEVIPRNPSGKILRRELRERFWADRDRRVN
ncbi:AMP-binding protein [Nocardia zapadnayensis]|uniref:AMP-binding protein n=1 Tax=Nocardia rhamnosiphila TaxID=426716 RepID=UPI0022459A00|nr:AMP-binding protein [Nocardia zapadnayensis]MCX0272953.1 AMP-binding protein [Nocardia zapadnayensis]